jgi:class 3 adenylate cyclase
MNREELLKVFAGVKKKLDEYGREVAFLSIDVVGSTDMKRNEDPAAAQYDFQEYRKLVEAVFRSRGVLKSAWTPDGVMACFAHVDDAVAAGQDVIRSLDHFNQHVKVMQSPFMVRCGVNAGYVHFDDATPMEAMSDRVIDIAGHMQKYAEPNTVAVAQKLIEPLRERAGFLPTTKTVDGYQVSHWIHGRN